MHEYVVSCSLEGIEIKTLVRSLKLLREEELTKQATLQIKKHPAIQQSEFEQARKLFEVIDGELIE